VILNRTLARYLFGDKNPIGRHLILGADESDVEVAGIAADSQYSGVRDAPGRFLYAPYEQCDDEFTRQASFFVRTGGLESSVLSSVTATARQLDANIPVRRLETMNALVLDSIYTERLLAILVAAFGVLAAILAAVGLFGTISYAVTRRTREFGIRIALGAGGSSILGLVLREVCWMLVIGVAAGLPASYALARLVESQLFGIRAHDPVVLIGATLLMAVVALAAGLIPGTRAMRIEPVRALKHE
jgi:ABC-type antimicrobial peptide transport system permease subunit